MTRRPACFAIPLLITASTRSPPRSHVAEVLARGGDYLDAAERAALHESIEEGVEDFESGDTEDASEFLARLKARREDRDRQTSRTPSRTSSPRTKIPGHPPSIVQSLRVVTASPGGTVPLRLVRMSTGADVAATPVTLMTLGDGPRDLVGQTLVAIDDDMLAQSGGTSNDETLVSAALGAPVTTSDAGADAGAALETRWLLESSRVLSARTSDAGADGGGAPVTLGDLFRETCGAPQPETYEVCGAAEAATNGGDVDGGEGDAEAGAAEGGAADAGAPDANAPESDAGSCTDVSRQRCDDLMVALPGDTGTATRFRGLVGGAPANVDDLAFAASTAPLRDARFTVRAMRRVSASRSRARRTCPAASVARRRASRRALGIASISGRSSSCSPSYAHSPS